MNSITKHNYEEYFILYADNELSDSERKEVEAFVLANPDLALELESFINVKLPADDSLSFEPKSLLKNYTGKINKIAHTESFLLYIDNELSNAEREEVEKYLLQFPQSQAEFAELKATILPPEQIVFTNKSVLYRNSVAVLKSIPFNFRQLAAAAVFGFLAIGWWYFNKPSQKICLQIPKHL